MSLNEFMDELKKLFETVWKEPPAEIKNLNQPRGPYSQRFTIICVAYYEVYFLADIIWSLRQNAINGTSIKSLKGIIKPMLESHGKFLGCYGLPDTGKLLQRAAKITPKIESSDQFVEFTTKLAMYLNKMGMNGWLELMIPWSRLGYLYEIFEYGRLSK